MRHNFFGLGYGYHMKLNNNNKIKTSIFCDPLLLLQSLPPNVTFCNVYFAQLSRKNCSIETKKVETLNPWLERNTHSFSFIARLSRVGKF